LDLGLERAAEVGEEGVDDEPDEDEMGDEPTEEACDVAAGAVGVVSIGENDERAIDRDSRRADEWTDDETGVEQLEEMRKTTKQRERRSAFSWELDPDSPACHFHHHQY
jgi:hypothetical protein